MDNWRIIDKARVVQNTSNPCKTGITVDSKVYQLGGQPMQADYEQNDSAAPDFIKNRPFGDILAYKPIAFDGNIEGRESFMLDEYTRMVKISDEFLSAEQLRGSTMTVAGWVESGLADVSGVSDTFVIPDDFVVSFEDGFTSVQLDGDGLMWLMSVTTECFASMGESATTGTYALHAYASELSSMFGIEIHSDVYCSSLVKRYTKKLDTKFLPTDVCQYALKHSNDTYTVDWNGSYDETADSIVLNGFKYVKVDDSAIPFEQVVSAVTERSDGHYSTDLYAGVGCYAAGAAVVVTDYTHACNLAIEEGSNYVQEFYPSSNGVYFFYHTYNDGTRYTRSLELDIEVYQHGIELSSRNKKWLLTIDDSGTISASEVGGGGDK